MTEPDTPRSEDGSPYARWTLRDPAPLLERTRGQWEGLRTLGDSHADLWVFGYASLIWRPDFVHSERHTTRVHGWHRALKMWSRINRGTPEVPGLVFALLPGGSCQGMVFRVPHRNAEEVLAALWAREMPTGVYDPRWLPCSTPHGTVQALTFTLSRRSPNYTGVLNAEQLQEIFHHARGRYGTTRDYARQTLEALRQQGIHDRALARLLAQAER